MKELNYHPNLNARRGLVSSYTQVIGLVLLTTQDAFYQNHAVLLCLSRVWNIIRGIAPGPSESH